MRELSRWVLTTFASPAGIVVLAALDSTVFFSLPFGIDAAVIVLAARLETLAWMVPVLATIGSVAGAPSPSGWDTRSAKPVSTATCPHA
jgi:hypothetical protein